MHREHPQGFGPGKTDVMLRQAVLITLALVSAPSVSDVSQRHIERTLDAIATEPMHGRMTLSKGLGDAQAFIEREVRSMGLQPYRGSYRHTYELTAGYKIGPGNEVNLNGQTLKIESDFVPLANSAQDKKVTGELVWAGLGMVNDSRNDYANLDVKGKIVVVFRGTPAEGPRSGNAQKARLALDRGAIGIVFLGPQIGGALELPKLVSGQGLGRASGLVGIAIHQKFARALLGKSYADELKDPKPRVLPATLSMTTHTEPNRGKATNVIAVLPGTDPKLQYESIIVGAHLDHLGYAETGSLSGMEQIHFGADDNASGSAGILEIARYFATHRTNRRTLIFQWYSGEELGLLGSEAWAKDNVKALSRTHLMVNLDMIGRLRNGELTVFGADTSPSLRGLLSAMERPGIKLIPVGQSPGNSDQYSFSRRGVPVLFANTGLHQEYHTHKDTIATLNIPGMVTVCESVIGVIKAADALNEQLKFSPTGNVQPNQRSGERTGRRVRTGFIPDMSGSGPGLLITGTINGSPAALAGIKAGDRLLKFDGKPVNDVEDLQAVLSTAKPGVPVKLVILRDGAEIEVTITPTEAPNAG
ncbi:MAG: M28 family peptidase [Chthonomonas sp.]|nr:M28 family peptidase [Chthonomonas sp.]